MKLNIYFWDLESGDELFSIHNAASNPFKLHDEIHLTVDEIHLPELEAYPVGLRTKLVDDNEELKKKFRLTTATIVKEGKYVHFNKIKDAETNIEYHCTIKPYENAKTSD